MAGVLVLTGSGFMSDSEKKDTWSRYPLFRHWARSGFPKKKAVYNSCLQTGATDVQYH